MKTKTAPKPTAIGLTDEQKIERLPRFGPGLKVQVPLHLWPAYQSVYHLVINEDLEKQQPKFQPIKPFEPMPPLLVKHTAPAPAPKDSDLWRCLECTDQPELLQPEMIIHMQQMHGLDTKNATGTKNLIMALDGAGFYQHTWEYNIDGMKFLRYHHGEKR